MCGAPATAANLTTAQISAALKRTRRRDLPARTEAIKDALRGPQLAQPAAVTAAYAAVRAESTPCRGSTLQPAGIGRCCWPGAHAAAGGDDPEPRTP
jgi:hypothetical protein